MTAETPKYSVLVVEDNPDLVMGLQDFLYHDGYTVTVAGTVADALELVRTRRFNVIILDLGLPDGDGLEVLRETRRSDSSLPVVIVTAHISVDRTVGSLAEGAFAYLVKPYDREELRHTLRRAIGAKELAVKAERTEYLLNVSEERFRSLVESASDAIVVADHRGVILSWNRSASTLFGYADEEAIGRPLTLLMPARYRHAHLQGLARTESTGKGCMTGALHEMHGLKKDGTEFPIELTLATWNSVTGRFYSGIIRDISARRKTEDALRRTEKLLRDVADNTTAVIYVKYTDGRYLFVNRRFEQIFKLTADQIVGHTDHEIFPREAADIFRANDVIVFEQNRTVEYEEVAPHTDGPHIYISIKFPLCDHTGRPYATCGISTDITERKRIEQTLRAHEDQLRLALTSVEMGTWNWDFRTGHICWSTQVDRFLGLSNGGRPHTQDEWLMLVYQEDRESLARTLRQVMAQPGTNVAFEHRVIKQNGGFQWCIWAGEIIRDHEGKGLQILGTVRAADYGV